MRYARLGRAALEVSRICLGTMAFGAAADEAESDGILGRALDLGVTFVDTADVYSQGRAEEILGRALRGRRDRVVLATKGGRPVAGASAPGGSREHLTWACESSLRRLGVDCIDLYFLHCPDPYTPIDETLAALEGLKQAGKIRHIGCSNMWAWEICLAAGAARLLGSEGFAVAQPLYNLTNRDAEVEVLPACSALEMGVVTYSPLARGVLTGKYCGGLPPDSRAGRGEARMLETEFRPAALQVAERLGDYCASRGLAPSQVPIAWALASSWVHAVVIGPRSVAQLEDNCAAVDLDLDGDLEACVDRLVAPGEHAGLGYRDPQFPLPPRRRPAPGS